MSLTLYELPPSPNNLKVRLALGYKGLEYEQVLVNPQDRSAVIAATGQPLTPALVHGKVKLFDSNAINRYLEANFPETPRIFPTQDTTVFRDIERWELLSLTEIGEPLRMIFGAIFSDSVTPKLGEQASLLLRERCDRLETRLEKSEWLVGDTFSQADICCAAVVYYAMLKPQHIALHPFVETVAKHFILGEALPRTRAWVERVVMNDPIMK